MGLFILFLFIFYVALPSLEETIIRRPNLSKLMFVIFAVWSLMTFCKAQTEEF